MVLEQLWSYCNSGIKYQPRHFVLAHLIKDIFPKLPEPAFVSFYLINIKFIMS